MIVLPRRALLAGAAALPASARAATAQTLVLYTSQPDRVAAGTVAAFNRVHPGIRVQVFRSGTTSVMNRLEAEFLAGRPKPDVLLIADAMSMQALKAQGRLAAYPGADVAGLPAQAVDPQRTYFGTKLITTGFMVNKAAPLRPARWTDLLRPPAKGSIVLPSPLYSGAAMITVGALAQNATLGPDYLARLAANGATAVQGNGQVLTAVAGGQDFFGIGVDFMAINAARKGSPLTFVFPADGATAVTEPVAILATARNPESGRAFVDFLLSPDGQALAARQGFLPARAGTAPPPGFPPPASIRLMPVDIARVLADSDALKRRFAALFGG
ncbi:MAG TPA: ABC transporter substrate-binding protein [Acetobacteraceae bacterium]|nr:ABC transporter substrate-binding protein [Acetobacteraceae bacterium]